MKNKDCENENSSSSSFVTVDASDIIRLILGYLTSQGFHESARTLRKETGIGFPSHVALVTASSSSSAVTTTAAESHEGEYDDDDGPMISSIVPTHIRNGEWGLVLSTLQLYQNPYPSSLIEHIILELASSSSSSSSSKDDTTTATTGLAMAQHLLAVSRRELDSPNEEDVDDHPSSPSSTSMYLHPGEEGLSVARRLEQRLAALAANPRKYQSSPKEKYELLFGRLRPTKTHSYTNTTHLYQEYKQERRNRLAFQFQRRMIHPVPLNRLSILIHQALKWQTWTGQFPMLKTTTTTASKNNDDNDDDNKSKRTKKKKRKRYDLLLGKATADSGAIVGDDDDGDGTDDDWIRKKKHLESIPSEKVATIKFGKSVVCEAVVTIRNAIITASSDGFIELWESHGSYDLNTTDYPYQAQDQVMGHDDNTPVLTLSVSRDQTLLASGDTKGIVKVWKLEDGTCLRHFQAHTNTSSITAIDWSPDGTKLLVGSSHGLCREFGIVSQHVLQEYIGHTNMIQSCQYYLQDVAGEVGSLRILTSSNDGTIRLWETHGNCQMIWQPPMTMISRKHTQRSNSNNMIGTSIVVDSTIISTESPSIVACCIIPSTPSHILIVPRASTAFSVNGRDGTILQQYTIPSSTTSRRSTTKTSKVTNIQDDDDNEVTFCTATVTAHWIYLCTTANECLVFAIRDGSRSMAHGPAPVIHTISTFGIDSTTSITEGPTNPSSHTAVAEISQIIPHPHKSVLLAFSNDKAQRKGIVAIWK